MTVRIMRALGSVEHFMRCQEEHFGIVQGLLREEPKVGKDRDQGGFYLGCQQLERVECVCCGVHMSALDH